jgi:hypothetical protein
MRFKCCVVFCLALFSKVFAQNLADGDLLFSSVRTQGVSYKLFSLVNFTAIASGEVLYVTDNAYSSADTLLKNEGTLKLVFSKNVAAGSVIVVTDSSGAYKCDVASVQKLNSFLPSATDQLFAYQLDGQMKSRLVAGINWASGNSWITSGVPATSTSYKPAITSIVSFGTNKPNGAFNCPSVPVTLAELYELVGNVSNWTLVNSGVLPIPEPCLDFEFSGVTAIEDANEQMSYQLSDGILCFEKEMEAVAVYSFDGRLLLNVLNVNCVDLAKLNGAAFIINTNVGRLRVFVGE